MKELLTTRQATDTPEARAIEAMIAAITRYDDRRLIPSLLHHPDSSKHVQLLRSMIERGALGPPGNEHSTPLLCAWIRVALPRHGCRIREDKFGENGCLYRDPTELELLEDRPTRSQTARHTLYKLGGQQEQVQVQESFHLQQQSDMAIAELTLSDVDSDSDIDEFMDGFLQEYEDENANVSSPELDFDFEWMSDTDTASDTDMQSSSTL